MINSEALRLQLVRDIIDLPDDLAPLVRDFLTDLMAGSEANGVERPKPSVTKQGGEIKAQERQHVDNPLLALVGCVSYDPPPKSIDEELYGEDPL